MSLPIIGPRRLALAALAVALVGCGGSGRAGIYPVKGRVVVEGLPGQGAIVTLHPTDGSTSKARSMAVADADGAFQVSTFGKYDGAPAGEYAVTLVWPEYNDAGEAGADRLKGRFATATKPFTKITVAERENVLDTFEVRK
ncbi:Uncharacterized protein OS=Singulisphaera acidiphila (strain ATCC BAA-1392 / DSM 18658 / VKM B-2454 / MOB10) GN=Sinac_3752 PE=4 SV=1 [Gemmataceae bacterium]|nr:Uncharacterized protein OS=Singulisphaera acidiphila (strain ATCC BAA-1392 / DSM 18658 / VKM B-2454 / MOB10) GN=Sinac_3752 PE=4 SV=1 [Gemmataceae bacterium]VTU00312.1 Uncharacterized protein OS=Singulisphaera acidiphila (strain ATCC BAA-1392 / DSM 18658 / VKM B-2454 / MOB10) GN=Sinac_3752 PE=4 SV=1 [Gemmataceae bacterium]